MAHCLTSPLRLSIHAGITDDAMALDRPACNWWGGNDTVRPDTNELTDVEWPLPLAVGGIYTVWHIWSVFISPKLTAHKHPLFRCFDLVISSRVVVRKPIKQIDFLDGTTMGIH